MAKRSGSYSVPFSFELLSFDEAVGLAAVFINRIISHSHNAPAYAHNKQK